MMGPYFLLMGPYFQQPRKKINQKAQGKKKVSEGGPYVPPPRHLVVKKLSVSLFPSDFTSSTLLSQCFCLFSAELTSPHQRG